MLRQFLNLDRYENVIEYDRARVVYWITTLLVTLLTIYIVAVPTQFDDQTTLQRILAGESVAIFAAIFYGLAFTTLMLTRAGRVGIASWGLLLMWLFSVGGSTISTGLSSYTSGSVLLLLILIGGLLQQVRGLIVGTVLAFAGMVAGLLVRPTLDPSVLPTFINSPDDLAADSVNTFTGLAFVYLGTALLIYLLLRFARVSRDVGVEEAVRVRETTAEIMTNITQHVSARARLDELLAYIVDEIDERFDYVYHAQIFLIDEQGFDARLQASTRQAGRRLLAMKHALAVGSQSVIGQVTAKGEGVIARAGSDDSIHKRNEHLPDTQVEAAFPLRIGERIIGALDLQSKTRSAFDDATLVAAFQTLTDSIALAVDNVGQFERAEARDRENVQLIEEAQKTVREVNRLNERLMGQAWSQYLEDFDKALGLAIDFDANTTLPASELTPTLSDAMSDNQIVQQHDDTHQVIAVPLRVGGQVIGAMEFELDEDREFSPQDFDLLREVGDRFSLAVENARLVNESQRLARREAIVNTITSDLQAKNSVDAILKEAARGLSQALQAEHVKIRLGTPDGASNGKHHGENLS